MSPSFLAKKCPKRALGNSKLSRKLSLAFSVFHALSYVADLLRSELDVIPLLAMGHSGFFGRVFDVLKLRARPQMIRAHAAGVIAMVKHLKSKRNGTKMQNPRCSMGTDPFWPNRAYFSVSANASRPNPASPKLRAMLRHWSIFIHLAPKTFWKRWGKTLLREERNSNFWLHRLVTCRCALQGPPALLLW